MKAFTWKLVGDSLYLAGSISEQTEFQPILQKIQNFAVLRTDVSGIDGINSMGVRNWLQFVKQLEERGSKLMLQRCPPAIVGQIVLINNFIGSGHVSSVLAPYYCGDCDYYETKEVALVKGIDPDLPETMECPGCMGKMEFDDVPEHYSNLPVAGK